MRDLALTSSCLPLFIIAYQNWIHSCSPRISHRESNISMTESCSPSVFDPSIMHNRWLMAKKVIEYDGKEDGAQYNWLLHNQLCDKIPSIIIIANLQYQIDFGMPVKVCNFSDQSPLSSNTSSLKFIQGPITTTYKGPFTTNNLLSKEPNRFLMIAA